ncbi:MAG: hypothetical protein C4K58_02705 [Flavobacteriaceae bacterium]|nr:MAG: hypothetical protein C4K58_02705 [Flavobacteriaceae bacterium]
MVGQKSGFSLRWHYPNQVQNKKGNQQKVQILDVRPFDSSSAFLEFEFTTHNIPLDILDKNSEELNQNLPVYVFCQSGKKSLLAVEKLNSLGFEAYQIEGGIAEILEVFE